jgi:hypothetical protein
MCEKALQVAENQAINMADNAAVMKNLDGRGFCLLGSGNRSDA